MEQQGPNPKLLEQARARLTVLQEKDARTMSYEEKFELEYLPFFVGNDESPVSDRDIDPEIIAVRARWSKLKDLYEASQKK